MTELIVVVGFIVLTPILFLLGIVLYFIFLTCVVLPVGLLLFPSTWIYSKEHNERYGVVRGLRDKLYHHFINYNHPNLSKKCGCKRCNYDGYYESPEGIAHMTDMFSMRPDIHTHN